uniref:Putative secreted protein n=1 Tax=Anopheles marajoara TaxID=58244 RepID=A0A2M4C7Q4_9DIPT
MIAAAAAAVVAVVETVATRRSHLPPHLHQLYHPPRHRPRPQLDQNHPPVSLPPYVFPCARVADPSARIGMSTVCICKPSKTRRAGRLRLFSAMIPAPSSPYRQQVTWGGGADSPRLEPLLLSF